MSVDVCTFIWLLLAALFTCKHAYATYTARSARSVSLLATVFFTALSGWNIYFFAHLGQLWSCAGSVNLFVAHAGWIGLQLRYRDTRRPVPFQELMP